MPRDDATTTLRWTFYLGGLFCISGIRLFEHYLLLGGDNHPTARAGITSLLLVAGMACFFLACRSTVPHVLRRLLPYGRVLLGLALLATLLLSMRGLTIMARIPGGLARPHHYAIDNIAMIDCGTKLFLHGHNPYTDFYLIDCLRQNGVHAGATTPLQQGAFAHYGSYPSNPDMTRVFQQVKSRHVQFPTEFEGHYSYPAGSFILPLPIMALGWHELSAFYLIFDLLAYLLLVWLAPRRWRPWVVIMALANITVWAYATGSDCDSLDVFLILAAWATWRRSWVSAILMGLAIATRQNSWFFVPFYAILIGRTDGWSDLARRLAMMAAIVVAFNAPFFLQAPTLWIDGVLGQLRDPMFSMGSGLIFPAEQGWLPLWPRQIYTALEITAIIACALYYARICRRQPGAGLVLALAPILVAWRSPLVYFVPLTILCLWPLLDSLQAGTASDAATAPDISDTIGERTRAAG